MTHLYPSQLGSGGAPADRRTVWASLATAVGLAAIGLVAGAGVTIVGLALREFLATFQLADETGLLGALVTLGAALFSVLAVSLASAGDGALAGLAAGGAVGLVYLLLGWLLRARMEQGPMRIVTIILLIVAGALAAALASQGMLAGYSLWAAGAGACFGGLAAFAVLSRL